MTISPPPDESAEMPDGNEQTTSDSGEKSSPSPPAERAVEVNGNVNGGVFTGDNSHFEQHTHIQIAKDILDHLADAVKGQWSAEEERRQIRDPYPLPVKWKTLPLPKERWANVHCAAGGGNPGALDLDGEFGQLAEAYRKIRSGQLVVLGEGGSGKTILAVRLVLDLLRTRESGGAIPCLFNIGSWDPAAQSLRDWMVERLLRDYPGLAVPDPLGAPLAEQMVMGGDILPVYDGFDEVAVGKRGEVLDALNIAGRFVLTSRIQEYTDATEDGLTSRIQEPTDATSEKRFLTRAAIVVVEPLDAAVLGHYLPRVGRTAKRWSSFVAALPDLPEDDPLRCALTTPLMVSLVRAIYAGSDRAQALLDRHAFPTREAIEQHLLQAYVPAVYSQPLPDRKPGGGHRQRWRGRGTSAQRWLGYLATRPGDKSEDLNWWELRYGIGKLGRILVAVLVSAAVLGVAVTLAGVAGTLLTRQILGGGTFYTIETGIKRYGLPYVIAFSGAQVWVAGWMTPRPTQSRLGPSKKKRGPRAWRNLRRRLIGTFAFGFGGAAVAKLIVQLTEESGYKTFADRLDFNRPWAMGLGFGAVMAISVLVAAWFEHPTDLEKTPRPNDALQRDRRMAILRMVIIGSGVGGLDYSINDSLLYALPVGTACALGYGLSATAWGQWLIFGRLWLPLTGRLPWAVMTFLEEAHQHGVLRQTGAAYQFRHARLRAALGKEYRSTG